MAKHQPPAIRREQILDAASQCYGTQGFHATRMDDIVKASGLSKGALYHHFASKDEIFLALFDRLNEQLEARLIALDFAELEASLGAYGETVIDTILNTPDFGNLWQEFFTHPGAVEKMQQVYQRQREILGGLIGDTHAATALIALVEGLLLQALVDPEHDIRCTWRSVWPKMTGLLAADNATK